MNSPIPIDSTESGIYIVSILSQLPNTSSPIETIELGMVTADRLSQSLNMRLSIVVIEFGKSIDVKPEEENAPFLIYLTEFGIFIYVR